MEQSWRLLWCCQTLQRGYQAKPRGRQDLLQPRGLLHKTHVLRPRPEGLRQMHRAGQQLPQGVSEEGEGASGDGAAQQGCGRVPEGSRARQQQQRSTGRLQGLLSAGQRKQKPGGCQEASHGRPRGAADPRGPRHADDPGADAERPQGSVRAHAEPSYSSENYEAQGSRDYFCGLQINKGKSYTCVCECMYKVYE